MGRHLAALILAVSILVFPKQAIAQLPDWGSQLSALTFREDLSVRERMASLRAPTECYDILSTKAAGLASEASHDFAALALVATLDAVRRKGIDEHLHRGGLLIRYYGRETLEALKEALTCTLDALGVDLSK